MDSLLWALAGFAILDSLNFFNVAMVLGIVYDGRRNRRSPLPGALAFLAGLFAATAIVGLCLVLGIDAIADLVDFRITPTIRYRAELVLGLLLICLALLPTRAGRSAPGWMFAAMGRRPWVLGLTGVGFGLTQAPVSVSYFAGMSLLAAHEPRVWFWPLIVGAYCLLAQAPSMIALALATRRTPRARRLQGRLVEALTRWAPAALRALMLVIGVVLLVDASVNHAHLW